MPSQLKYISEREIFPDDHGERFRSELIYARKPSKKFGSQFHFPFFEQRHNPLDDQFFKMH